MPLCSLDIVNLRAIEQLHLDLDAPCCLITGANGAGKTTVLEAIYLLARGTTFRGRKAGRLIREGEQGCAVRGQTRDVAGQHRLMSFRKTTGETHWSEQRNNLPSGHGNLHVKLIGENPQSLFEGKPDLRRRLLDWNLFHVEPTLGGLRRRLNRTIHQRNMALRHDLSQLHVWNDRYIDLAEQVTRLRQQFVENWSNAYQITSRNIGFLQGTSLRFQPGWAAGKTLAEAVAAAQPHECNIGHTLVGPGRADLALIRAGRPIQLSRGQAKVVVCLLQLAAELIHRTAGLPETIWLLDDLEAEIDNELAEELIHLFNASGSQILATRVTRDRSAGRFSNISDRSMFHVERGAITAKSGSSGADTL